MLLILGQGYSGSFIAEAARAAGFRVTGVTRDGGEGLLRADDPSLPDAIARATHILSTVPPDAGSGEDPMLARFGALLAGRNGWLGYLSTTGVYRAHSGAWIDESAPTHGESAEAPARRINRAGADAGWRALGAAVFRLPGIYGPGRSTLDRVRAGTARRIDRPGHRICRIHVADVAGAVVAAAAARATGPFNVVDKLPAEPARVTEFACNLLGAPWPPLVPLEQAGLSPRALGFWAGHRAVSAGRLVRETGYRLRHPDYKAGLTAIFEED